MSKGRSIFEEVEEGTGAPKPASPSTGREEIKSGNRAAIRLWLVALAALVAVMVLVGGLTRLTDSGLSITEWNLVTGILPPMSDAAWQVAFDKYKQIPEYQLQNAGMDIGAFKTIYWWEWGHRILGRLIGLVWAAGFLWFLARGMIPVGWTGRLLFVGALGGLQGAIGWWMVSSGLEGRMVDVASYRLATHLGLAFLIFAILVWFTLRLGQPDWAALQARRRRESKLMGLTTALSALVFLQILLGALVAGIDAGRGYIDWPLMNGAFLPDESFDYAPLWTNFFENPALTQFNHRILAYLIIAFGFVYWRLTRASAHLGVRKWADWVAVALLGQVAIGIVTVINAAPLHWAIVHQAIALALTALLVRARFEAAYPVEEKIART